MTETDQISWASVRPSWVLGDDDIASIVKEGRVISGDTGVPKAKESCVELTVGRTVHLPFRPQGQERLHLSSGDCIVLMPGEVVSVVTDERLELPLDGYGRIYPKGRMTTIGLSIASTNVDPGFQGPLILSITNASRAPISLERGTAIAKLELSKLAVPNSSGYSGAHGSGHDTLPFDSYFFPGEYKERVEEIARKSNMMATVTAVLVFLSFCILLAWPLRNTLIKVWHDSPGEILGIFIPLALAGVLWVTRLIYVKMSTKAILDA